METYKKWKIEQHVTPATGVANKKKLMQTYCNADCISETWYGVQFHMQKLFDTVTHTSAKNGGTKAISTGKAF